MRRNEAVYMHDPTGNVSKMALDRSQQEQRGNPGGRHGGSSFATGMPILDEAQDQDASVRAGHGFVEAPIE